MNPAILSKLFSLLPEHKKGIAWKLRKRAKGEKKSTYNALMGKLVDKPAGRLTGGYYSTIAFDIQMQNHRIAWMIHNNQEIPRMHYVGFKNGDTADCRISNLELRELKIPNRRKVCQPKEIIQEKDCLSLQKEGKQGR